MQGPKRVLPLKALNCYWKQQYVPRCPARVDPPDPVLLQIIGNDIAKPATDGLFLEQRQNIKVQQGSHLRRIKAMASEKIIIEFALLLRMDEKRFYSLKLKLF